jgi:protein gp37
MGQNTKIEWTHRRRADGSYIPGHTFNPWIGCEHKINADGTPHPGCEHCYAEAFTNYTGKAKWGTLEQGGTRTLTSESYWRQPAKWNAEARAAGERQIVFCASFADVFEDWQGPIKGKSGGRIALIDGTLCESPGGDKPAPAAGRTPLGGRWATMQDVRRELFALIDETPWLDWLLLTKRPGNVRRFWRPPCDGNPHNWARDNVWLITSVSNQPTLDELTPELLRCRDLVPVLGLSAEPLLGPLNLRARPPELRGACLIDHRHDGTQGPCQARGLDWIIVGGESGHHARPMHPDWARSIRDQCQAAGVAFFFKQWGEYTCHEGIAGPVEQTVQWDPPIPAEAFAGHRLLSWCAEVGQFQRPSPDAMVSQVMTAGAVLAAKVGKHAAGRELDGREWGEFPQVQQHQGAV